jgi:hypothetical protein
MGSTILRKCAFFVAGIEGEFFPVAHRPKSIGGQSQGYQIRAGHERAAFA